MKLVHIKEEAEQTCPKTSWFGSKQVFWKNYIIQGIHVYDNENKQQCHKIIFFFWKFERKTQHFCPRLRIMMMMMVMTVMIWLHDDDVGDDGDNDDGDDGDDCMMIWWFSDALSWQWGSFIEKFDPIETVDPRDPLRQITNIKVKRWEVFSLYGLFFSFAPGHISEKNDSHPFHLYHSRQSHWGTILLSSL